MANILIVDDSEVVRKLVEYELKKAGYGVATASDGKMGLKMARQMEPDLVVLDVQMPEMDGYEVCQQIRRTHSSATMPIIMLTSLSNLSNMQQGYTSGVDDYLTKPFKPLELKMRIESLLKRASQTKDPNAKKKPLSQIIALFSLRGGAGCTSLATNIAVGLSQMWESAPILLDLATPTGAADVVLDLKPQYDLSSLAHHEISALDEDLFSGHLTPHSSGLRLLGGTANPADAELITENVVSLLLDHAQNLTTYVVIDTSHDFSPATLAALDAATRIVMPITPDMISVRSTKAALGIFDSLGYPNDKIEVIVNWTFPQDGIERQGIEKALGRPVLSVIPFMPSVWSRAINIGTPVILGDPNSQLVTMLENMVWYLSTNEDHASKRSDRSEMWRRVAKRRWKKRADETEVTRDKK